MAERCLLVATVRMTGRSKPKGAPSRLLVHDHRRPARCSAKEHDCFRVFYVAGPRTGLEPVSALWSGSEVPLEIRKLRRIATFSPPRRPGVRGLPAVSNLW